jgi:hypothetical protein
MKLSIDKNDPTLIPSAPKRVQAYFYLPEDVLQVLKKRVPQRELSRFVADALRNEFRRLDLRRNLETHFGILKSGGKKKRKVKKK